MVRRNKPKRRRKIKGRRRQSPAAKRLKQRAARRSPSTPRQIPSKRKKVQRSRKPSHPDAFLEIAIRQMNRGDSLTATARSLHVSAKGLEKSLKRKRLVKRKGKRWVSKDNRPRRVPVMTGGRVRVLTVRGYEQARLVGEHHHAVGEFVRTNAVEFIEPFRGQFVQAANGRRYALETRPNALHRIAAMDSPPFHEIYKITSQT